MRGRSSGVCPVEALWQCSGCVSVTLKTGGVSKVWCDSETNISGVEGRRLNVGWDRRWRLSGYCRSRGRRESSVEGA